MALFGQKVEAYIVWRVREHCNDDAIAAPPAKPGSNVVTATRGDKNLAKSALFGSRHMTRQGLKLFPAATYGKKVRLLKIVNLNKEMDQNA